MANRKHLEILQQGVFDWNQWREERPDLIPDLSEAYLREANLVGFDLHDASLHGAMLLGADLTNANLRGANLTGADIRFAELNGARLAGAHFEKTKGVTAGMMRQAQRPMRLRRSFSAAATPVLVAVVAIIAIVALVKGLAGVGGESESAQSDMAAEIEVKSMADPSAGDLLSLLRSIRFRDWSIVDAGMQGGVLTIELDVAEVDETIYLPTLATTCGALRYFPEEDEVREIRILDQTGTNGWAYDRPRNCPAIMQAPTHMLRLAAGADSLRWQAR